MKKQYAKPTLLVENLGLSGASAGCEGIANFGEGECSVLLPDQGFTVFPDMNICDFAPEEGEAVCYHNPTDANNVFSS